MKYTTRQLAEVTGAQLSGDPDLWVSTIEFDTRQLYQASETAFIAISTAKNSGEKYISAAVEKGVRVIIAENKIHDSDQITWLIVENAIQFIQKLAKFHRQQFALKTVGITGSNGKTIVKEWLYQCLSTDFSVVKSPKSYNSQLGLPLSLLQIEARHELGLFEAGISKSGEMESLAEILSPEIGILTHIGTAHAANFSSEAELIDEKIKLFRNSKIIIFNGDNELVRRKIEENFADRNLISFGFKETNDLFLEAGWQISGDEVVVHCKGERWKMQVRQRDEATLSNAMAVMATLKTLGISTAEIITKINALKAIEMRLESVDGVRQNLIINDSYNLDLDSLKIALQSLSQYNKSDKVLILTDILEGRDGDLIYEKAAALVNQQDFRAVFLIGNEIVKYHSLFGPKAETYHSARKLLESGPLNALEDHLILIKGARKFETEVIKTQLELQKHDTVLEIDLNAILHNILVHKNLLKPETKMMAMVKAYSYGLGGYEIAEFLQHHHIDYLGVAYADEGVSLRKNGITVPIMVMNPEQHSYSAIIDHNLEPEIYSLRVLHLFNDQLVQKGIQKKYPIHLKIETGMHRLGFPADQIGTLLQELQHMNITVASIFSHLSSADDAGEKDFTHEQLNIFEKVSTELCRGLNYSPLRHILNSAGIINYTHYQYDMVRIGIGMVGISPSEEIKNHLQPAVKFKSVVSQISEVKSSKSVGYSRAYKPREETRIATLPVGYADGIPRLAGNGNGHVGIKGKLYPIVGNICMDMMMVDVGFAPVSEGDEVIIFNSEPSLEKFAEYCKTIPYEVLTSISRRVKRIYIKP